MRCDEVTAAAPRGNLGGPTRAGQAHFGLIIRADDGRVDVAVAVNLAGANEPVRFNLISKE